MEINTSAFYHTPTINQNANDIKLREQTDAFEALILKHLLDISLKDENALYPKEPGSEIYQSMYRENVAENLSGSFGYSDLLFNYLKDLEA